MSIPNGPWCLPPVNRYATQGSLRACVRLSHLDDVNALCIGELADYESE
jgi:hypothetical protein